MLEPGSMQFGLLGPLLVRSGGTDVPVRRGKQRTILAVLLLNAGGVVSVEKLIDTLWEENPPPSADVAVRNYVMRLRRDLGPAQARISTRPPGYLIGVADGELDVFRCEALVESARAAAKSGQWDTAANDAAAALALWRGEPLCDVESAVLAEREVPWLTELRLRAAETRIEADLQLGRHAEVIGELEQLTAAHPLRENLHAQLMLALYRAGRQAEALGVYQSARRSLVGSLGIEPGEALRDLHQRILSGDPGLTAPESGTETTVLTETETGAGPGPAVPHQLPPAVSGFVGRDRELAALSGVLDREGQPLAGSVVISVISGTAGVGKTALAVQWAHQVSGRFPDGQLYVNLRGYDPGEPVTPAAALAGFLRALGVPGERIPDDTEERAAAFRSLLAGRRMLIVLDNARGAAQVRPLLPGSSSCAVVVTSRDVMSGLVARDGAARVDLDLLPMEEAAVLLRDLIGERAAADPAATARLAECCCRLPLALRVAGELAIARPGIPVADLAAELAGRQGRLKLLDAGGDARTDVRAVFSWSYEHLDPSAARAFRLIGLHPGPDFDAYTLAALAGDTLKQAGACLERLARTRLIQPAGSGRYGTHDLLLGYARELAATEDGEDHNRAAVTRLFDYYAHTAAVSVQILFPGESHPRPVIPGSSAVLPLVHDTATAQAWLDAERASLVAIAVHAADIGSPVHATSLSTGLFRYLDAAYNPSEAEARAICARARRAAQASGDREREAGALANLATVGWRLGRIQACSQLLRQALALAREVGDRDGEARLLSNLAGSIQRLGWFEECLQLQRQALALHRELGNRGGEASALGHLGIVSCLLGRSVESLEFLRQALALYRETGSRYGEASVLRSLSRAYERAGQCREAAGCAGQALELFRELGAPNDEADALSSMAEAVLGAGEPRESVYQVRQALALYREVGDRYGEAHALNILGEALCAAGQPVEARVQHEAALRLSGQICDVYEQARAHYSLGRVNDDLGNRFQARHHWQRALVVFDEMGIPEAEQLREHLTA